MVDRGLVGKGPQLIRDEADVAEGLAWLSVRDTRLSSIIEVAGPVPLRLLPAGFGGLAQIVVSQMVSKASAAAIWRRMSEQGAITAESFLAQPESVRATFGLSRAKTETLMTLARAVADGSLDLDDLANVPQAEAYTRLVAMKGIGPWTAEVYLMFCLGHCDLFPAGDVALRIAVGQAFDLPQRPTVQQVSDLAAGWSPWRSVAARLFWAYYASVIRRDALPTL